MAQRTAKGFKMVRYETMDGTGLLTVMPTRHVVPLARPGMPVRLCDQRSDSGIILACLAEACVVRGHQGEICSIGWGEVELIGCQPDPACLTPTPSFDAARQAQPSTPANPPAQDAPRLRFDHENRLTSAATA